MTPDQIVAVQQSMAAVDDGDALAARFYDRLFELAPDTRPLFTSDPAAQRAKFADQLRELVAAISDLPTLLDRAGPLGARHAGYGVSAQHYPAVGDALIEALRATLGERFTADVEEAWRMAYSLVSEAMLQSAATGRLRG